MAETTTLREPPQAPDARPRSREGIVVSTVLRLTTTDGERFEDINKAMEHEAFYQIIKRLVKELGWADDQETAAFATKLSQSFHSLLPLLSQLETDSEALRSHLAKLQRLPQE
jgi:hypothetical protein